MRLRVLLVILGGCGVAESKDAGGEVVDAAVGSSFDAGLDGGVCTPLMQARCAGANGVGVMQCSPSGSAWEACVLSDCDEGYGLENGVCVARACAPLTVRPCSERNGSGLQQCGLTGWGPCALNRCDDGYDLSTEGECLLHRKTLKRMSASFALACAQVDDSLFCWGSDRYSTFTDVVPSLSRTQATLVFDGGVNDFSLRGYGAYCRIVAGQVFCTSTHVPTTPVRSRLCVDAGATVVQSDNFWGCALVSGRVQCWPLEADGVLGSGAPRNEPVTDSDVTSLAMGGDRCAVTSGGALRCWGAGSTHTVFDGGTRKVLMDQARATCALVDSSLSCWAANLGAGYIRPDGSIGRSVTPEVLMNDVRDFGLGTNSYMFTACAVKLDGSMSCWGNLGVADQDPLFVDGGAPARTYFTSDVQAVVVGSHSMVSVVRSDGGIESMKSFELAEPVVTWGRIELPR